MMAWSFWRPQDYIIEYCWSERITVPGFAFSIDLPGGHARVERVAITILPPLPLHAMFGNLFRSVVKLRLDVSKRKLK